MLKLSSFLLVFAITILTGCTQIEALKRGEGFIDVEGGKVWYRIVGEGHKTPILLLHGGPAATSYYLNPLSALGNDRPVIFFDQLGCGRSDRITDTAMMTVEHYVEEVEQIRKSLGLEEFVLYGSSWGTMLGIEYYSKYPKGIKGIIFSGACISIPLYLKGVDSLLATLPDSTQAVIRNTKKNRTYESADFKQANQVWTESFVARKLPWSPDLDSVYSTFGTEVYNFMWGPTEFSATGNLKDFDRTDLLNKIKVPTLFMVGEYDEVLPSGVKYYHSLLKGSEFVVVPNAAHFTMQDNTEFDIKTITNFLNKLDI